MEVAGVVEANLEIHGDPVVQAVPAECIPEAGHECGSEMLPTASFLKFEFMRWWDCPGTDIFFTFKGLVFFGFCLFYIYAHRFHFIPA